jgi:hypothetical protein
VKESLQHCVGIRAVQCKRAWYTFGALMQKSPDCSGRSLPETALTAASTMFMEKAETLLSNWMIPRLQLATVVRSALSESARYHWNGSRFELLGKPETLPNHEYDNVKE